MTSATSDLTLQAKLFRGFSDPSRLAILDILRNGPRCVSEIVAASGLSQSNTSNHLACLAECGLVEKEQQGKYVYYRLSDDRVISLLALSSELLATRAEQIYACTRYNVREGDFANGNV